jgi:putative flippase GtrA
VIATARTRLATHSMLVRELAGYVAVSGTALCVDFSIYWALLGLTPYAFVAAAGGYVFGVMTHYALSSRIVFRHRFDKRGVVAEAPTVAKFFAAGLAGLTVTAIVVGLIADVMGGHPLMAKIMAAGCSFLTVFTILRLLVFVGTAGASPSGAGATTERAGAGA